MESKHTSGPWVLKSWHEPFIVTREGDLVAMVYADKNRKLIAAAPDMLAALRQCLPIIDAHRKATGGDGDISAALVRDAIRKATGE